SDLMIMMLWADIEEKYAELLAHISDPILQEQVKDYIIDTTFRKDIFVRGARRMNAREMLDRITSTRLAILGSAESFDSKIEAYGRSIKLDKNNHHASLLKQLEKGPCTIKSLHQHKILGELPISGLFNLICCCISQGHIAPLREAEEVTGIESAKRFNKAIIRRTRTGEDFDWLAAPEIGYGIHCPRAHRIFYDAIKQGRDPVDEMVTTCKLLGQGLVKDGESVTDIDEAITELKGAADRFRKRRYKYLDRAGIAA
ncbi:MAG: methyltransferase regulatory domain-containing protein, partial [Methyloligellaceae bacterium]